LYRGDTVEFVLELDSEREGTAWLRTNLCSATQGRRERVRHVEFGEPILGRGWHDIPMPRVDGRRFRLVLPVLEVGRFEAKSCFIAETGPHDTGTPVPEWPGGDNVVVKVEPAACCCANTMYTAFVRQFGSGKDRQEGADDPGLVAQELDAAGYAVIPRSGTFRDFARELDFILGTLRFRTVQLLPVHPVPTTYARMGRFGSPFASLDFTDVDPAMAEFDRTTTPREQFREVIDAVHYGGGRLFMDLPINHTGWASHLQIEHPEWFARREDREFQSPGAWGVTWEDLSKLDYSHTELWEYIAGVFLLWCRLGVDGFRCDAGYMVPCAAWTYIAAKIREQYPDTVFLLEGLGGDVNSVNDLLDRANLDWAYSELFQQYDRQQVEQYLSGAIETSNTRGLLVHYAETHDNPRLASVSTDYARMRTALAALCSEAGAFGITGGLEWFATEKIDVHEAPPLAWGNPENQVQFVARLNTLLEEHPCFHAGADLRFIHESNDNGLALLRTARGGDRTALVLVNLDVSTPCSVRWPLARHAPGEAVTDLLSGRAAAVRTESGLGICELGPGEVLCLGEGPGGAAEADVSTCVRALSPDRVRLQELRARALDVLTFYRPLQDISDVDPDLEALDLAGDTTAYCREAAGTTYSPVAEWRWPRDRDREVLVPPGHFLHLACPFRFTAELRDGDRTLAREVGISLGTEKESALFLPRLVPRETRRLALHLSVHEPGGTVHAKADVLYLAAGADAEAAISLGWPDARDRNAYAVLSNRRGTMAQVRGAWAEIRSQYDAMLAANLPADYPADRLVMLTRCRAWIRCRGYSQEIGPDCQESFGQDLCGDARWTFRVPTGGGETVALDVRLRLAGEDNESTLTFRRHAGGRGSTDTPDEVPVNLVVRPDVEDRVSHSKTKAYEGAEDQWNRAVKARAGGFTFSPGGSHRLEADASSGTFTPESEWLYMVEHPEEAGRGLEDHSDLFSPGYFKIPMLGGEETHLVFRAGCLDDPQGSRPSFPAASAASDSRRPGDRPLIETVQRAMQAFVVRRRDLSTVIAGYPWFLDWGRDTLICLRGMIAAGLLDESRQILRQFARFESSGTLPNMLRGSDASDRDTSDAPLWFFVACEDLARAEGSTTILEADCGGRTVRDVLVSIVTSYRDGTPNGIGMDPDSGLIFSPSHFTWMDTNHPAGSPREGYPIEIQALWHAALRWLGQIDPGREWAELASRVSESISRLFSATAGGSDGSPCYLSDCLHASKGQGAAEAVADDALRPNQLLAVTLGALGEGHLGAQVISACESLLVPGAIRSLADRPVSHPLPVRHNGQQLNDPHHPYRGTYRGDEDTRRKPAYHNGTAWTWVFPSYCEAMLRVYGDTVRDTALSILGSSTEIINRGCLGQVPEIVDGNAPHELRGCGAQAWGVTELYRVLVLAGATV